MGLKSFLISLLAALGESEATEEGSDSCCRRVRAECVLGTAEAVFGRPFTLPPAEVAPRPSLGALCPREVGEEGQDRCCCCC